jgi:hypothetical protein
MKQSQLKHLIRQLIQEQKSSSSEDLINQLTSLRSDIDKAISQINRDPKFHPDQYEWLYGAIKGVMQWMANIYDGGGSEEGN